MSFDIAAICQAYNLRDNGKQKSAHASSHSQRATKPHRYTDREVQTRMIEKSLTPLEQTRELSEVGSYISIYFS